MNKEFAKKYDKLLFERDRYKNALEKIKELEELRPYQRGGETTHEIAEEALND